MRNACKLTDMSIRRMMHEPTAACLGLDLQGIFVVVDMGAGTTDLSAVEIAKIDSDLQIEVLHSSGDNELGGIDFDEAIYECLLKQVQDAYSAKINSLYGLAARLRIASERIKIDLSQAKRATYDLHGMPNGGHITLRMTRAELIAALEPCIWLA